MFDLKKSKINKSLSIRFFVYFFKFLKGLSLFLFIASILLLAQTLSFDKMDYQMIFFFNIFFLSCFMLFSNIASFFTYFTRKTRKIDTSLENEELNLADFLSIESALRIKKALKFARRKKVSINSSILLYFILNFKNKKIDFILMRLLINKKELLPIIKEKMLLTKDIDNSTNVEYTLDLIILEAAKACIRRKGQNIKVGDILSALSKIEPSLKEELRKRNLKKEDLDNVNFWQETLMKKIDDNKIWWSKDNLSKLGSLAKDWASGFTPTLDKYSIDLSKIVQRVGFMQIIGHEEERSQVERILIRDSENNILLVGENGVGRSSVVRAVAQRSFLNKSLPAINGKRFVELNLSQILTQTSSIDEVENILDVCFREASYAGNIILILSDFDNYINDKVGAGLVDISSLIVPYLKFDEFKFIALTSFSGLHKYIEYKPQVLSLFEKVEIKETTKDETILIMEREIPFIEYKYNVFITYSAILKIIELSEKYIHDNPFPKKAVTLLTDTAVYVNSVTKGKIVLASHIEDIISEKTDIPVGKISSDEREVLLNLENLIHKRIINQVEAVNEISASLRRARSGMKTKNGPMGTFLFLGPTGVGKTETAKALAEVYFGSESKMIRFDMSEFQTNEDIKRFIGDDNSPGLLATNVRENPFSLVLFDEIEKSHPNILNLLLQILDEGYMTDSLQRKIDFSNTIIIATSNAGYQIILDAIKENKATDLIKQEIFDYVFDKGIFRPELINRFDSSVIFKALTKDNLLQIADLRIKKLQHNLARKQIALNVSAKAKMEIVELSYNPQFGAREIKRVLQEKVENVLAKAFLAEEIQEGDSILINENFEIIIEKRNYEE